VKSRTPDTIGNVQRKNARNQNRLSNNQLSEQARDGGRRDCAKCISVF
jgi:hypothetical protein